MKIEITPREAELTYLALQLLVEIGLQRSSTLTAVETDSLRADLRNKLSQVKGMEPEVVQNLIEIRAKDLAHSHY